MNRPIRTKALHVVHADGRTETADIALSGRQAGRVPRALGRAIAAGIATATLDGAPRTVKESAGNFYLRLAHDAPAA